MHGLSHRAHQSFSLNLSPCIPHFGSTRSSPVHQLDSDRNTALAGAKLERCLRWSQTGAPHLSWSQTGASPQQPVNFCHADTSVYFSRIPCGQAILQSDPVWAGNPPVGSRVGRQSPASSCSRYAIGRDGSDSQEGSAGGVAGQGAASGSRGQPGAAGGSRRQRTTEAMAG